jgi:tetratricopeptide (TPR) repeat protein
MREDQPDQETIRRRRVDLQLINRELDADPHNTDLWARKALAFEQAMIGTLPTRSRLERTLLWWEQCLPSTSWTTYYNCAAVLRRLNRHEEALGYVRQALALEPGDPRLRELEAQTLQRLGPDYEERMRRGEMTFVLEAADPEQFTLQMAVDELTNLGLTKAAEDLCVHFEISHGPTSLTRSQLMQLKFGPRVHQPLLPGEVTGAYPLLEIARSHVTDDFIAVVDRIFAEGKAAEYFPLDEVNDFDERK